MTYKDPKVIQLSEQVVPIKLNAEKEGRDAARKYAVRGYPTILFLTGTGEVAGRIGGFLPPEPFAAQVKQITEMHRQLPKLLAKHRANPEDAGVAAKLAALYAARGNLEEATKYLAIAEKNPAADREGSLAKAYNAVGDQLQLRGDFNKAVAHFQKAAAASKAVSDKEYAHMSIATCWFQAGKPKEAIPSLEAVIAMKRARSEFVEQAKQMLRTAKGAR